jgi:hypothetical protein
VVVLERQGLVHTENATQPHSGQRGCTGTVKRP